MSKMSESEPQYRGSQFLMVAAALVIVVAGLRAIKPIALPFIIAILLSVISAPLVNWLVRHRLPRFLAVIAAVLSNVAVVIAIMLVVGGSIKSFSDSIPDYQRRLEGEVQQALSWLEGQGVSLSELDWLQEYLKNRGTQALAPNGENPATATPEAPEDHHGQGETTPPDNISPTVIDIRAIVDVVIDSVLSLVGTAIKSLAELGTMILLIFLMMVFLLFEATKLPKKLELALGWRADDLSRLSIARREIQRYLGIKTLISLSTGTVIGLWVWFLGLDYPELWGLIAFLFNYIPNIGSIIAAIPAVILALIEMGLGSALLIAFGYAAVNLILGNFLEPLLLGRKLGLSTLVVFLSLVFWGWTWGPLGMLLSVPLTMVLRILLEHTKDLRWIAQLIAANPLPERTKAL